MAIKPRDCKSPSRCENCQSSGVPLKNVRCGDAGRKVWMCRFCLSTQAKSRYGCERLDCDFVVSDVSAIANELLKAFKEIAARERKAG